MVERGAFLEWAEVLGNHYGTAMPNLEGLGLQGMDLILDIDIQGAREGPPADRTGHFDLHPSALP